MIDSNTGMLGKWEFFISLPEEFYLFIILHTVSLVVGGGGSKGEEGNIP